MAGGMWSSCLIKHEIHILHAVIGLVAMAVLLALSMATTVLTCIYHLQWRKRHATKPDSPQNGEAYEEMDQLGTPQVKPNEAYGQIFPVSEYKLK